MSTLKQTLEAGFDNLAHWFGWLGPYRVSIRVPVGQDDNAFLRMGAFTEAQGLRMLHEWGFPGILERRGKLVALKC